MRAIHLRAAAVSLAGALLAASGAWAQVTIDKNRPAPPDATVRIENSFGSIRIVGWDRKEVAVKGVLAAGAERLEDPAPEGVVQRVALLGPVHGDPAHARRGRVDEDDGF